MIIILKRQDLPDENRHLAAEDLQLEHSGLSADMIDQAALIVFVDGQAVKFLKHVPGMKSKENLETLLNYITQLEPVQRAWSWTVKGLPRPGKEKKSR
jgi:hypothetical protein